MVMNLAKRLAASTLMVALAAGPVLAQETPAALNDSTTVRDVTIIGGKVMPTTEDPKSATCEFLVATDPSLRALIDLAKTGGDSYIDVSHGDMDIDVEWYRPSPSALMAPTIYQPTRLPVNVDWTAAPLSAPGSALPEIGRQYRGIVTRSAQSAEDAIEAPERRLYNIGGSTASEATISPADLSIEGGINTCRALRQTGGFGAAGGAAIAATPAGKTEIAYRDTALPTAQALFRDHRYAESLDYFQRAYAKLEDEMGGDEAALMIGKLYLGAPGVERDTAKALTWLKKAAGARFNRTIDMPVFDPVEPERNTAIGEAAVILARLYQTGAAGVSKDAVEARRWFERALEVGHVPAAAVLGDLYAFGAGVPADAKKAFDYYKKGASLGYAPAQNALADMYATGEAPGGKNVPLSLAWRNEAAKLGNADALYELGLAYDAGEGVTANPERALSLYKLAALAGSPAAKNAVGTSFYEGRGVAKDASLARRWFEQGAAAGDPDAMFNLGAMMMKGEGGEADRTRAWVWLKMAEKGENSNAAAAVGVLEARMTNEEKAAASKLLSPTNS